MHRKLLSAALAFLLLMLAAVGIWLMTGRMPEEAELLDSASLGLLLLDAENGVYVLAVSDGSEADLAGLQPGDRILSAGDVPLLDSVSFNEMLQGDRDEMLLTVRRKERELRLRLPCR